MKRHINIPIFVPHNGCPHDCIFCNQKKIAGAGSSFDESQVRQQIEAYLSSIKEDTHVEIAFFGGSFTGIPWSEQKAYLDLAKDYCHRYGLKGIRMSTRPDMISTEILDKLGDYPITTIELGVQSMNQSVLDASLRGHTVKDIYKASQLIRHYGFGLGLQMMLGLPEDTPEKSLDTCDKLIAIEPDAVRIYPTLVVKDTGLERLYYDGSYKPLDLEATVDLCAVLAERFDEAGIKVLRIGLQATDSMVPGKDVVAGPYHPAIGQLVDEKRWVDFVLEFVQSHVKEEATGSGPSAVKGEGRLAASVEGTYAVKTQMKVIVIETSQRLYQTLIGHKKGHLSIWAGHEPTIVLKLNKDVPPGVLKIDDHFVHRHDYN